MMAVPAVTPVTIPVVAPTVATAGVLLLQVPPGVALLKVVVAPTQWRVVPVMPATTGAATTVSCTKVTDVQPNAPVYT